MRIGNIILIISVCAALLFIIHAVRSPQTVSNQQSETERRCRYLGHNEPDDLKNCIWAHRAQEMSKWRPVDWDRWKSLTGATNDEVLRQQAAVWLEIMRQKKNAAAQSKKK